MSSEEDIDLIESWIEVTPQTLGYQPIGIITSTAQDDPSNTDLGSFHTNVEEILLNRLLTEAQGIPDVDSSQGAPPSPPPSRDCLTPAAVAASKCLPPGALLYAAALKASSLSSVVTTGPGEWASRPEVGGFLSVTDRPDVSPASSMMSSSDASGPQNWLLRHSPVMKSRLIAWLIDRVPTFLSHAATFLLGAATMLFLLRKRIHWPKGLTHLPLD